MTNLKLTLLTGLTIIGASQTLSASDSKTATPKPTRAELLARLKAKTGEKAQERNQKNYRKSIDKHAAELQNYALDPREEIFYDNHPNLVNQFMFQYPELSRQSQRAGQGFDTLRKVIQIAMREYPDKAI